jgi:hypothetical protein
VNLHSFRKVRAEYAEVIYGPGHDVIEKENWDKTKWIEAIRAEYTLNQLIAAKIRDVEVQGKKISALYAMIIGEDDENPYSLDTWLRFISVVYDVKLEDLEELLPKIRKTKSKPKSERGNGSEGFVVGSDGAVEHMTMPLEETEELVEKRNEFYEKVRKKISDPKDFMKLHIDKINELDIEGEKFGDISEKLGLTFLLRDLSNSKKRVDLAKRIYGEGHKIIECENWDEEQWIEEIKSHIKTPEDFMSMDENDFKNLEILNRNITALLRCIGIKDEIYPSGSFKARAIVARKIYGEGHDIIECEFWSPEKWIEKILDTIDTETPEEWMRLTQPQRDKIVVLGKKEGKLSTYIGISEFINPQRLQKDHARVGRILFGEGHDVIDCEFWNISEWIENLKRDYPTREIFLKINRRKKIFGKGIVKIGRIFGIKGKFLPKFRNEDFYRLVDLIYG